MTAGRPSHRTLSDVLWPRRALFAAIAAAVAVAITAAVAPSLRVAAPGALSSAHVAAGAKCASCHAPGSSQVLPGACVSCHGPHPSTRVAHRALQGRLTCATCHATHDPPSSLVTTAGIVTRVPIASCTGCHDPARSDDPLRACRGTGEWSGFSVCFDEHQTVVTPLAARGACAREHGPDRFVAWEQARRSKGLPVARRTRGEGAPARWVALASGGVAGVLAFVVTGARRKRRASNGAPPPLVVRERVRLPRIDATSCLGCQACVDACPFDALAVDRHLAVLARPDACCGAGACERACPNGSLRIVDQDEPVEGRPHIDAHLESVEQPGIFVVGDLTGLPLIRNAIAQGAAAADRIAATLVGKSRPGGARVDVAVVGSGPAGLSCALRARELGLSCVVLEQSELAASIRAFPRAKIVHDAPVELPVEGRLWFRESTREELVAHWTRVVRLHQLDLRERHRVTGVVRSADGFVVTVASEGGARALEARRVVLATGRRGTPRPLDAEVAPDAVPRISYALSDAKAWTGKRVLVVGLGDSALEAIVALARQPATEVTVSYRGASFARGSSGNIGAVQRLGEAGRVRILFGTRVTSVDGGVDGVMATVEGLEGTHTLRVDGVLALLGGVPSRALLEAAGVHLSGT